MQVAEELCSTFNEAQVTLDAHLDTSLSQLNIVDVSDATFLRQAVYGTDRYHALIKATLAALYHFCGGVVLRKDRTTYALFTYLAVIRLVDLGVDNFAMLVTSQPAQKMLPFIKFLFDPEHVKEDLGEEWLKTYDREFVNECVGVAPCPSHVYMVNMNQHKRGCDQQKGRVMMYTVAWQHSAVCRSSALQS